MKRTFGDAGTIFQCNVAKFTWYPGNQMADYEVLRRKQHEANLESTKLFLPTGRNTGHVLQLMAINLAVLWDYNRFCHNKRD